MRTLILAVSMMIMPFIVNAHDSNNEQIICHKNEEGIIHCHATEAEHNE